MLLRVALFETIAKYKPIRLTDLAINIIVTIISTLVLYRIFDVDEALAYLIPFFIFVGIFTLFFFLRFAWNYAKRLYWTGYLAFEIYPENGVVSSSGDKYVCIYVHNGDIVNFEKCFGEFFSIKVVGNTMDQLDISHAGMISWAGKRNPGDAYRYETFKPEENNVLHFARIAKDISRNRLTFFTLDGDLHRFGPGIYDVGILLSGECLGRSIRKRKFHGRIIFNEQGEAKLTTRNQKRQYFHKFDAGI